MPWDAAPEMRSKSALTVTGSLPQTDLCCRVQTSVSGTAGTACESSGGGDASPVPETGPQAAADRATASRSINRIRRFKSASPSL